jgi:hypothetical protein
MSRTRQLFKRSYLFGAGGDKSRAEKCTAEERRPVVRPNRPGAELRPPRTVQVNDAAARRARRRQRSVRARGAVARNSFLICSRGIDGTGSSSASRTAASSASVQGPSSSGASRKPARSASSGPSSQLHGLGSFPLGRPGEPLRQFFLRRHPTDSRPASERRRLCLLDDDQPTGTVTNSCEVKK